MTALTAGKGQDFVASADGLASHRAPLQDPPAPRPIARYHGTTRHCLRGGGHPRDRGQYSPVPESRSPSTAPLLHSAPANPTAGAPPRLVEPQIRRFVGAVDRFQSSTEVRAASDSAESAESAAEAEASSKELDAAARDFRRLLPRSALESELEAALLAYRQAGSDYARAAVNRRGAAREYLARLDDLDGRITASIDTGWKIFGRVLARESLLTLHAHIEELRHRIAASGGAEIFSPADLAQMAAGERSVRQAYDASERGLSRSQTADWLRQTHEDITRMATLREVLSDATAQMLDDRQKLASSRARLLALTSSARAAADNPATADPSSAPRTERDAMGTLPAPARSSPIVAATTTTTTTTDTLPDRGRRFTVAALTAGVLYR